MNRTVLAVAAGVPAIVLLLPAYAAACLMLLFSALVRRIGRALEPAFVPWQSLIEFSPSLGWKPRPNLDTWYLAELDDVFRVVTDEEGWPGTRRLEESDIVVVGDSFAFGYGVNAGASFADVDRGLSVKAVGAPGYSMVHGVLLMEQLAARLRGRLVVWLVYPENDLQDNLAPEMRRYRAPFARRDPASGAWEIVDSHVTAERWPCSDLDRRRLFPHFGVPGPLADRAYGACEYLIQRAAAACRLHDAALVVLTVPHQMQLTPRGRAALAAMSGAPDQWDADLPDRRIAAACRREGIPVIAGKDHLSAGDYKRREGIHWNERGHRRIAAVLRHLWRSFRAVPGRTVPAEEGAAPHVFEPARVDLCPQPEHAAVSGRTLPFDLRPDVPGLGAARLRQLLD